MATALLEKQKSEVKSAEGPSGDMEPVSYHWTVDALYRALDAGVFEYPERLELIQGRIVENMPQNAPHASLRRRLSRRLRERSEPLFLVTEESSIRLALDGEPVPDVAVMTGTETDYDQRHPTQEDTVLVVEVSDTTVAYDLGGKSVLYAQAGIADYWVVLVNDLAIVRHREPTENGYQDVVRLKGEDILSPSALPEAAWTINKLLGREGASKES